MKKLLTLLLLTPIMYAKEYTFSCTYIENDSNRIESLLINTKEKYITFRDNAKYSDGWEETETFIGAELVVGGVRHTISFNKITGNLNQYNEITLSNGSFTSTSYNFNCVQSKRLMP